MGKDTFNLFMITFGILIIALLISATILQGISTFVYFFVKGSGEAVSDNLSELITVSAGTPGTVKIDYYNPSDNYNYNLYFQKKMVLVDAQFEVKTQPLGFSKEELEKAFRRTTSSSAIFFNSPDKIIDFHSLVIEKRYSNGLMVNVIEK